MLFQTYMDASGKLADPNSDFVVLAGALYDPESVDHFAQEWSKRLRLHSNMSRKPIVRSLHTVEANRRKGQFDGWTGTQVGDLLLDLATLTRDSCYKLFTVPTTKADYIALPQAVRERLGSVAELSFEICINAFSDSMGASDQMYLFCDDEEKEAVEMYRMLKRYKLHHETIRDRFVAISFVDDRFFVPIQAADLLAYAARQEHDRRQSGNPDEPSALYRAFTQNGSLRIEYGWDERFNVKAIAK